jgi:hypothetical protein
MVGLEAPILRLITRQHRQRADTDGTRPIPKVFDAPKCCYEPSFLGPPTVVLVAVGITSAVLKGDKGMAGFQFNSLPSSPASHDLRSRGTHGKRDASGQSMKGVIVCT